ARIVVGRPSPAGGRGPLRVWDAGAPSMAEPAQTTRPAPLRRDAVLEAVTFAADRLCRAADWHDAIDEVLAGFGIAAGVSRATILRADPGDDAGPLATAEAEWCAPGVPSMADHPSLRGEPWSPRFVRWVDAITAGQPIVGDVGTFPSAEREDLTAQGIAWVSHLPNTGDGSWWGWVGFGAR